MEIEITHWKKLRQPATNYKKWQILICKWINVRPSYLYDYSVLFKTVPNTLKIGDVVRFNNGLQAKILSKNTEGYFKTQVLFHGTADFEWEFTNVYMIERQWAEI